VSGTGIALLMVSVIAFALLGTLALLTWARREVGPLTKDVGPLHKWTQWDMADDGHEILDAAGKSVATQERRCNRCGLRQVDEIGELAEPQDMDGRCSLIYGARCPHEPDAEAIANVLNASLKAAEASVA
jgi:hypothetical protein